MPLGVAPLGGIPLVQPRGQHIRIAGVGGEAEGIGVAIEPEVGFFASAEYEQNCTKTYQLTIHIMQVCRFSFLKDVQTPW